MSNLYDGLGYRVLRRVFPNPAPRNPTAYASRSKLEVLFGPRIWTAIEGRIVLDFGCGEGEQVVELAQHGAARVVGLDSNPYLLRRATRRAAEASVSDRCTLTTTPPDDADVIVSLDCFEHFSDPKAILDTMADVVKPGGEVWISFGPPWYHPLGGHLFSVFPWSHLLFSEQSLVTWRADFKRDKPHTFFEAGLNKMTVRRFTRLIHESRFDCVELEAVPIRRLRWLASPLTIEFTTAVVQCRLRRPEVRRGAASV